MCTQTSLRYKVAMTHPSPFEPAADPYEPARMLALIDGEQERVARRMVSGLPWILFAWGVAWLAGFGALWLIDGARPAVALPAAVAIVAFVLLMTGALSVSAFVGARMGRGLRQAERPEWIGPVFGLTWPMGLISIFVVGAALSAHGMSSELLGLYLSTVCVMFVGVMYILAGGIWRNWQSIAMGVWFVLLSWIAPFFGAPANLLVYACAGGGMFLLGALYVGIWMSGRREATAFSGVWTSARGKR